MEINQMIQNVRDTDLLCILNVVSNIYGLNNVNNIIKTSNQVNRFAILEYFEKILESSKEQKIEFSNDRLVKALQKSIKSRLDRVGSIEILYNIKRQMMKDIKMLFSKFLNINESNLFIVNSDKNVEDILVPYFYRSCNQISFKTNDKSLFSTVHDLNYPIHNVINTNIEFTEEENNIYYVSSLDGNIIEKLKKNPKFIIDINSDKHNLRGIKIVSLDVKFNDDDIDINNIYKIWASLLFLNLDCLLN